MNASPTSEVVRDAGMTLVELLVTMVLVLVVSLLVVVAVSQASRVFLHTDDEAQGLGDAKTVLDRVARDIRESRGVVCPQSPSDPLYSAADPGCASHLQVWIDNDSDYAQDASEVVTWKLLPSGDGQHFDVIRTTPAGSQVVANSLIVQTLFEYDTANPEDSTLVNMTMDYDARVGVGVSLRKATTAARLRNG